MTMKKIMEFMTLTTGLCFCWRGRIMMIVMMIPRLNINIMIVMMTMMKRGRRE